MQLKDIAEEETILITDPIFSRYPLDIFFGQITKVRSKKQRSENICNQDTHKRGREKMSRFISYL